MEQPTRTCKACNRTDIMTRSLNADEPFENYKDTLSSKISRKNVSVGQLREGDEICIICQNYLGEIQIPKTHSLTGELNTLHPDVDEQVPENGPLGDRRLHA